MADDDALLSDEHNPWVNMMLRINHLIELLCDRGVVDVVGEFEGLGFTDAPHAMLRAWLRDSSGADVSLAAQHAMMHIEAAVAGASDLEWARQFTPEEAGSYAMVTPGESLGVALRHMAAIPEVSGAAVVVLYKAGLPLRLVFEVGWRVGGGVIPSEELTLYEVVGSDDWTGTGDELVETVRATLSAR